MKLLIYFSCTTISIFLHSYVGITLEGPQGEVILLMNTGMTWLARLRAVLWCLLFLVLNFICGDIHLYWSHPWTEFSESIFIILLGSLSAATLFLIWFSGLLIWLSNQLLLIKYQCGCSPSNPNDVFHVLVYCWKLPLVSNAHHTPDIGPW